MNEQIFLSILHFSKLQRYKVYEIFKRDLKILIRFYSFDFPVSVKEWLLNNFEDSRFTVIVVATAKLRRYTSPKKLAQFGGTAQFGSRPA